MVAGVHRSGDPSASKRETTTLIESFSKEALDEVFPRPSIREVSFEIRFAPRLRVNAELWKIQDEVVTSTQSSGANKPYSQTGQS
jgi:hypothetical protein